MTDQAYGPPAGIYGPVADWATDLDHADPAYNPRAPEIWAELRERGCPVVHSDRYGGMWAPLTHELVSEVAYDTENFTSRAVVVSTVKRDELALAPDWRGAADHERSAVPPPGPAAPAAAVRPKKIEPWEPEIRKLCRQRLDDMGDIVAGETVVDAALQYAQHIPVNVIARMLGFPIEDDDLFREFVHDTLEGVNHSPEERKAGFDRLDAYIDAQIEAHQADEVPRDDLTSYLLERRARGPEAVARARPRVDRPAAARRHRHDVERDRLQPVAPRRAPRRPPPAGRRARADADRDRGVPPGLRPGDDGPHGGQGPRLPRLPDEGRRLGAVAVPGGQPRSGRVRPTPTRSHRPAGEPPRRVRSRHPPLPRLEPRPPRARGSRSRSSSPASPSSSSPTPTR